MPPLVSHQNRSPESDPITGLPGRDRFYEAGRKELSVAQNLGVEIALVLIQVDSFDNIFNRHGSAVAKQVLRKLARYIDEAIGSKDVVTRLGTSCFAIVPEAIGNVTVRQNAVKIIERVRNTRFDCNGEKLSFTVSIGIGSPSGKRFKRFEDLVELVGRRLLVASVSGGDRIVC